MNADTPPPAAPSGASGSPAGCAPIRSLLVANRGEIARRIFRTAREMGLRCIAVYTEADAGAPFVTEADEAFRLPDGYLNSANIVAAAAQAGVDAVHPGYGFLSEDADFARAVIAAGLVWVGPTPETVESMGDKLAAKRLAQEVGVPLLPSADDPSMASYVGYPLLIKAAAGGGGKGMRLVEHPDELNEAIAAAQREARASFGDDRVFLERYVARARHVEVQVLGDAHGNLIHLGERECSIQRRHQKIIEESPSPAIDADLRVSMCAAAISLAERLQYRSAGTVEFLLDDETRQFYFLETNTRLQVEHPVTEAVTGIDIVREQLRVASGEVLSFQQHDVTVTGHAVEARLYAEDPATGFLPCTGTIEAFAPAPEPAVRWDSGIEVGSVVGLDFDPMLAKVIAHGPTRSEASGRLALALERLHLGGVTTNRGYLAQVLRSERFISGDTTTAFVAQHEADAGRHLGPASSASANIEQLAVVAALWAQAQNHRSSAYGDLPSGWRNSVMPPEELTVTWGEQRHVAYYRRRRDGSFALGPNGDGGSAIVHSASESHIEVSIDGRRARWQVTRAGDRLHLTGPMNASLTIQPRFAPPEVQAESGGLTAPMPGIALEVRCTVGSTVRAGQTLVVLEAMKMEHHITAPFDGTVVEVSAAKGQQVAHGALLVRIEPIEHGEEENAGEVQS